MSQKSLSREEQAARGKRLLIYGMFALVLVTVVTLFITLYLWLGPVNATGVAIQITLTIGAVAIVACLIIWFVYTKLISKR